MLHEFSYLAPREKKDLLGLLKKHAGKARLLAGGTDLMCDLRSGLDKPACLIDVKHIKEFQGISFSEKEGLSIGATVTCIEMMRDPIIGKKYPLLAYAAGHIGSSQLRNRATIGGNLCTASPCADMGCSSLALGGRVELVSARGTRVIPMKDFFTGVKETLIQEDEVVQRVIVPPESVGAKWGMEKLKRIKGHDMAVVSVAMARTAKWLRVGIGSCAPTPVVLPDLPPNADVKTVTAAALKVVKPIDDVRASKDFRLFMVGEFIAKLLPRLA